MGPEKLHIRPHVFGPLMHGFCYNLIIIIYKMQKLTFWDKLTKKIQKLSGYIQGCSMAFNGLTNSAQFLLNFIGKLLLLLSVIAANFMQVANNKKITSFFLLYY